MALWAGGRMDVLAEKQISASGRSLYRGARLLGSIVLAVVFLGVAGRMLDFPLNRDENLFVTVSAMAGLGNLYDELGYNHLPYFPWLLGSVYRLTGTEHYLLVGRLVALLGWATAVLALWLIARRARAGFLAFCACSLLLMGNVLLLGKSGMLVSNNFLPVPAALLAVYFLLLGLDMHRPSPRNCLIAGLLVSVAIGFKANYVFLAPVLAVATVVAPASRSLRDRLLHQCLPLAAGGLIGGAPILLVMASDPDGFFAHTLRYFIEMQAAYWSDATEVGAISAAQKVLLAESAWNSDASLLALVGIVALVTLILAHDWRAGIARLRTWPMLMLACLTGFGIAVAFVPTPSFPQYFVPPIPFIIAAVLLLRGATFPDDKRAADSVMLALALMALLCSSSRLVPGLLSLGWPSRLHSMELHREMRSLAQQSGLRPGDTAATLTPVLALEAGLTVPPEFAAGQFTYRVADHLPARDRRHYTTTSPSSLSTFLDSLAPAAIVISGKEKLEEPFARYAREHGYIEVTIAGRADGPRVFRRP